MSIEPSPEARARWRLFGWVTVIPGVTLFATNTIRLGFVDHLWPLAIGLDAALVVAIPGLCYWLRQRDTRNLSIAPAGTLYIGGASFRRSVFTEQPGLRRFLSGAKFRTLGTGWMSGTLRITGRGLFIEPGSLFGRGLAPVSICWDDVRVCELTKVPGKVNTGGLDLTLADGSKLSLEARGYDRLHSVLRTVKVGA